MAVRSSAVSTQSSWCRARNASKLLRRKNRFEINASKETGEVVEGIPSYFDLAPAKYTYESTLTASVTESGDATFDFALDSESKANASCAL